MKEVIYNIPGAPALALLTDLHNHPFQDIIQSLKQHQPEYICLAGDIIYGKPPENHQSPLDKQEYVLPFLEACAEITVTFMSLGNHEHMLDEDDLLKIRSTGVILLDNTYMKKDGFVFGGLTSGYTMEYRRHRIKMNTSERYPHHVLPKNSTYKTELPETEWLSSFAHEEGFKILLSHHPEYVSLIPKEVDLILSGHAHGGQMRIFGHGLFAPGQGVWPKWTHGLYENRLVVSAGLANTAPVPRWNNPVEIVYINN